MNERHPDPHPHEPEHAPRPPNPELDETVLAMVIGEALLQTVESIAGRPADEIRPMAIIGAMRQVHRARGLNLDNTDDRHTLAIHGERLADALTELAHHYDGLTTSDLQGATDALALRTIHGELPADAPEAKGFGDGHE